MQAIIIWDTNRTYVVTNEGNHILGVMVYATGLGMITSGNQRLF